MMGFHAASGVVSVISASHSRDYCVVLLFTVLFSNSNLYVYRRQEYSNSEESNPVQVAFCN